jgi:hypothetical protein
MKNPAAIRGRDGYNRAKEVEATVVKKSRPSVLSVHVASVALFLLAGCASVRSVTPSQLAAIPVTSVRASLRDRSDIAPGEKAPLMLQITASNGAVLTTEGSGGEKVPWRDVIVTASVVAVNGKGVASLPSDPRISDGKLPHVSIAIPSHPGVRADLDIPVHYDRPFALSFSGRDGFKGADGRDGLDGIGGTPGSTDPDHPSAGGDGGDGGNGADGGNGENGGDGPPVQLRVALRAGSHPLLQVSVSAGGRRTLFLVDPQGGSLTVTSKGGDGGLRGSGGRGGSGGSGGIGSPNGRGGRNGLSGINGSSGSSGSGGSITVTSGPSAKPYLGAIRLSNPGGPRPVFKEAPVAPLW